MQMKEKILTSVVPPLESGSFDYFKYAQARLAADIAPSTRSLVLATQHPPTSEQTVYRGAMTTDHLPNGAPLDLPLPIVIPHLLAPLWGADLAAP